MNTIDYCNKNLKKLNKRIKEKKKRKKNAHAELTHSNNMRTLSMRIVTYLIEYLGEFEFIFKTMLDYESGDQVGSFDEKKPPSKISWLGTFYADSMSLSPGAVQTLVRFCQT
jgi:hypothetical protein